MEGEAGSVSWLLVSGFWLRDLTWMETMCSWKAWKGPADADMMPCISILDLQSGGRDEQPASKLRGHRVRLPGRFFLWASTRYLHTSIWVMDEKCFFNRFGMPFRPWRFVHFASDVVVEQCLPLYSFAETGCSCSGLTGFIETSFRALLTSRCREVRQCCDVGL